MTDYAVVTPVPVATAPSSRGVRRREADMPRRVGFVWNFQFEGDKLFAAARSALTDRFGAVEFIGPEVFGNIHGHDETDVLDRLPERLVASTVDSVILGVGG